MGGGFSSDRLLRLAEMERSHFWFVGRRRLLERLFKQFLPAKTSMILELGPGVGGATEHLVRAGHRVIAIDLLADAFSELHRRVPEASLVQADAGYLPLQDGCLDAAVALDVLEHVDDRKALLHLQRVLRPGAVLILTVPAFPFLWSYRDEAAGHIRRYRKRQIRSILTESGFDIEYTSYYQFFLFMLAILSRMSGKRSPVLRDFEDRPPGALNKIFSGINCIEVDLGRKVRWPMGSSLVVVCRTRCA